MNKTAGYVTGGNDNAVVGEIRQCSHCQFTWAYRPGSGAKRAVCLKCMGLVCGKASCMTGCAPVRAVSDEEDKRYRMNTAGVMVKI